MNDEEYERMNSFEEDNWWWAGKRQLISKMLERLGPRKASILDIGCGTGSNLRSWERHGNVLGMDIASEALNFCRLKGNDRLLKGDAAMLPFRSEAFDVIVALDILEHIEKDAHAVKEFFRVCRRGGHILLTVPALMMLWSRHDVALHHKRRYARQQLVRLLESGGFQVEKMSFWNSTLLLPAATYRIGGNFRRGGAVRSDGLELPKPLNVVLKTLLSLENRLILSGINLPRGITLFAVGRKT
ncbi:MAG: class I SAM-dependent methyltransferase [Chloroflexi bacterium]|nr:class I SAM-dependent methyltransferase [Chloroflexota bacterium]